MTNYRIKKTFPLYLKKNFCKNILFYIPRINFCTKKRFFSEKTSLLYSSSTKKNHFFSTNQTKKRIRESLFFNFSFDKSRLKSIVSWFFEKYGHYKTILFLEKLKEFGFGYATTGGISLGIDDLKIPNQKIALVSSAETKVAKDLMDYKNAKITGIERTQRLIYTWNKINDMLKEEVLQYFSTMDLFNPIYMMAFSGARGNMSQVRQLVGMRGLMSDPQGQIIDFPIQSNFREGLTLTEYLISTYGARKGIVDTALRTATAGYLTRRLVDVAQHVIVAQFDCGTSRGIFLFDMKEANKTIYSFQNRLIGRVLAQDISKEAKKSMFEKNLLASRNQEIDSKLAFAIAKISKKALVRSPLTCETPRLICQLCYGWSLSQGKLVSVGEAVGIIAAQSIGEPGTQLTMRTFHTGGVFAGGLTDQILAPFRGRIQYIQNIPGNCIRTSLSEVAFLTKIPGFFFVICENQKTEIIDFYLKSINNQKDFSNFQIKWKQKAQNWNVSEIYKIPAYAVLYLRNHEVVQKQQVLAQFSTVLKKSYGSAEQTLYSSLAGEFILNGLELPFKKSLSIYKKSKEIKMKTNIVNLANFTQNLNKIDLLVEKRSEDFLNLSPIELKHDIFWKSKNWTNIWILSGKMIYSLFDSNFFFEQGDYIKKTSVLNRILWKKKKNWNIFLFPSDLKSIKEKTLFQKNLFSSSKFNKKNKFQFLISTNLFFPFKNLLNSFDYLRNKKKYLKQKIFFIEHYSKKTNFKNFFFSSLNFWTVFLKNTEILKHKSFAKKNVYLKSCFISFLSTKNKQIFYKIRFLPFSFFFFNILFFSKEKMKNKKFLKAKNDILFHKTFPKIFFFSYVRKQKEFIKNIVSTLSKTNKKKFFKIKFLLNKKTNKKKKHLKQVFFKFSTFHRTTPFFQVFSFSKTFNNSTNFINKKSISKKIPFPFKFSFFKICSNKYKTNQIFDIKFRVHTLKTFFFQFFDFQTKFSFIRNKKNFIYKTKFRKNWSVEKQINFTFTFIKKNSTNKNKIFCFNRILKKHKFLFSPNLQFSFFKFSIFKNNKTFHNFKNFSNFHEKREKQIFLQKTFFSFHFKKIRYNKNSYIFSFQNLSKNERFSKQTENSFQIFTKLKQSSFDLKNIKNPGKQKMQISFSNGNFIGKDFPTFRTYFFPKNYQTITNGIFTILPFVKDSKKQKYQKFFCLEKKMKTFTRVDSKKLKKHKKKFSFLQNLQKVPISTKENKKLKYSNMKLNLLNNKTFYFINKKKYFQIFDSIQKLIQKNIINYHFVKYSKKQKFNNTFCFFENSLATQINKKFIYLKKYNFQRFSRIELYQKEIFWIPQENYKFPIFDFFKLQQKKLPFEFQNMNIRNKLFMNEKKKVFNNLDFYLNIFFQTKKFSQKQNNKYISKIIFKKNPLFYLSNIQGKKKTFFPVLEGIITYSISSNKSKYKLFDSRSYQKMNKKLYKIQQKLSFYKLKKKKNLKKQSSQLFSKKSSLNFLRFQMFKFYKIQNQKLFLFFKRKNYLSIFSKFFFEKKFKQIMQKNFLFAIQKKINYSSFEKMKKFFSNKFEKIFFSTLQNKKKITIQKIGKSLQNHCFTCLPFQKKNNISKSVVSFNSFHQSEQILFKKQKKLNKKFIFCSKTSSLPKISKFFILKDQEVHLKIQSGWICIFPDSSFVLNWHQKILDISHFYGNYFCFEQNKILQEIFILDHSTSIYNIDFQKIQNFSTISNQNKILKEISNGNKAAFYSQKGEKNILNVENSKKMKISFCLKFLRTNKRFRFFNMTSMFACQTLSLYCFEKTMKKEPKFIEISQFNKQINISQKINKHVDFKLPKASKITRQKRIATLFRPMQYKLVENPQNYKKIFLKNTLKNNSQKSDNIYFVSSLKIYKKYHSIILNIQKPNKKFIQNSENIQSIIKTNFQKIYKNKELQKGHDFKQTFYLHSNKNKLINHWSNRSKQKYKNGVKFHFLKNLIQVPHFQFYSKKTLFLKFHYLLNRIPLKANKIVHKNLNFSTETLIPIRLNSDIHFEKKKAFFGKFFFSFYPIQFILLSISNSSLNIAPSKQKNFEIFPTLVLNSLKNKIDFSICHKKAAFFNQRFSSFDYFNKIFQTSFWLNNDGKNIFFINSIYKNLLTNLWKMSFPTLNNQKNSLYKKNVFLKSKNHINFMFKNFVLQKNQNFYANTQFFSPFDGELISMSTNELNWWKKASEISTIQKLNILFTVLTKKDLFSLDLYKAFKNKKCRKISLNSNKMNKKSCFQKNEISLLKNNEENSNNFILTDLNVHSLPNFFNFTEISLKYSLKTKQKHLDKLYKTIIQNLLVFDSFNSMFPISEFVKKNFSVRKVIKTKKFVLPEKNKNNFQIFAFIIKYQNKIYKFKNLIIGSPLISKQARLGKFFVAGDCIFNFAIRKPGQVVHLSSFKVTLRRGQPFLVSPKGILHLANIPYIEKNIPILTLPYQTLESGDIVQGIPKVEQFFEARTTIQGRLFISSLPILLKGIFRRYKTILSLEQAVRQSFLKIQQLIVDGVQRVYRLQGVSIMDKHLEVIVRQMTTKVQIIHGAQTGFFPGELVNLYLVERINKFLLVKVRYEPIVLGITRASLEVDSFLSASSFQQTTKILALASISRKKDFLKGLKENILVGNLIPSGTGYVVLGKHL